MQRNVASRAATGLLPRAAIRAAVLAALGLASSAFGQVTGFGGASETGWQASGNSAATTAGVPNVTGTGTAADVLTITSAAGSEASSYWTSTPQSITNFVANFTYTDVTKGGADGFVFGFLHSPPVGGGGGSLGFSGVAAAAGDVFSIYSGNGGSTSQFNSYAVGQLARTPTNGGVDITNGNAINVTLNYTGTTMAETLQDTVTGATGYRVYQNVNLSNLLGGGSSLIGFTGGTGGVNALQQITNFSFTPGAGTAVTVNPSFTPIAVTGFNQNMIVSPTGGTAGITATMDGGTAKTGNTYYQKGVDANNPNTGLPAAGSTFLSAHDVFHSFQISTGTNNAVMLDATNTTGTLTLTTQKAFNALSFLVADANGSSTFTATVHFANGAPDEVHAGVAAPDWFNNGNTAVSANGRETVAGGFGNQGSSNPRLYQSDITLADSTDPITSIDFTFGGSATSTARTAIYGISGAVPEPGILGSLAIAGVALLRRRRA